ncbi:hypothetical protein ACVFI8_10565 [Agarivorans sp. MS3-6]
MLSLQQRVKTIRKRTAVVRTMAATVVCLLFLSFTIEAREMVVTAKQPLVGSSASFTL